MQTLELQLRPQQEFIELHKLLKFLGVAESGAEAKMLVAEGMVTVDGALELRKACKIRPGQVVELREVRITVLPGPQA